MLNAFIYGVKTGWEQRKIALIAYGFQFLLAAVFGMQVYKFIQSSIGNSLEINKLLHGYDHTVVSDLLNVHGAALTPILAQLPFALLIYLLFSVFVNAGLMYAAVTRKTGWKSFWKGSAAYFFPFLKVAVVFSLIFVIWSLATWVPFMGFFPTSPEVLPSEKTSVILFFLFLLVYLTGVFFLFTWSVVARTRIIEEGDKTWKAIGAAAKFSGRRAFPMLGIFFLYFIIQLLLLFIYWQIEAVSGMTSGSLVLVFFFIQQLFVFLKWVLKISTFSSLSNFYQKA